MTLVTSRECTMAVRDLGHHHPGIATEVCHLEHSYGEHNVMVVHRCINIALYRSQMTHFPFLSFSTIFVPLLNPTLFCVYVSYIHPT